MSTVIATMAARAPFGTDLQPNFDVRVVAGKLIHTPVINSENQLPRVTGGLGISKTRFKSTSISGAVIAHKQLKEKQGHLSMDRERDGVSRPRSKRVRNIDILPILEEGAMEALEEPSPLKVANTIPKTTRKDHVLPSIVVQAPTTNSYISSATDMEQSAARLRVKELHTLVEMVFNSTLNKLAAVRNIRQSCNRADHAHFGVLSREVALNIFRSHGVKIIESDLSKLCELIPCSMGKDHVLYDKLCGTIELVLNKTYPNTLMDNAHNTLTPVESIGSDSPDSVDDYSLGYSLPMLADLTNSHCHSSLDKPQLAKPKNSRSLATHPLGNSLSKPPITKLPLLPETQGVLGKHKTMSPQPKTGPVGKMSTKAPWPLPLQEEREDGIEKMFNALKSCTDSEGMLESEHAHRVVQNYNLIYKLGMPSHQIRDYIKINSQIKIGEPKPFLTTDHFLRYLTITHLHNVP